MRLSVKIKIVLKSYIRVQRKPMINHGNKLNKVEVLGRLLELINDMPDAARRSLMEDLEKRLPYNFEDRRKHPRKTTFITVECYGNICHMTDVIQNLSASGLHIETQLPFSAGDKLSMTFSLAGTEEPIKVTGKIVRIDSKGIGVEFDEPLTDI